jgi:hypothetical protein
MVEKIQKITAVPGVEKVANSGRTPDANLRNENYKSLNIDRFGLSPDARNKVEWARAQFELNYQVLKSLNSANGFETTEEIFSFKGSYEFLQRASGGEWVSTAGAPVDETATEEAAEQDQLTNLQDYFSPENTAKRILDVATSFFGISEIAKAEGDTEAARQKFSDFIGGAINEGFRQARNILGDLPEDVSDGIDKTHSLIFSGLADFVKNGISPEKLRPGGVFDKIAAYREEAKAEIAARLKSSSTVSYNSSGEAKNAPATNPNISTKG